MEKTLTERILSKKQNNAKKGCKKAGRNKVKCGYYRSARSFKNKLAKLDKHLATHVTDLCAIVARERHWNAVRS